MYSNTVFQYAANWERLGLTLGLNDYEIENISKNNAHNPRRSETCCAQMLEDWLKKIFSSTWGKLDDAVTMIQRSDKGEVLLYADFNFYIKV